MLASGTGYQFNHRVVVCLRQKNTLSSNYNMEECHVSFVFEQVPLILEKILDHLPSKSLNACARVCKKWNECAQRIRRSRKKLEWISLDCSEDDDITDKAYYLKSQIEDFDSEPEYLMMFCSTSMYEQRIRVSSHAMRLPRSAKCEAIEMKSYLSKVLPRSSTLIAVSADGVVGSDQKSNRTSEMEDRFALTMLSIPKIEGLDIYTFFMDIYPYYQILTEETGEVFDVRDISTVPEDKEVKALFLFCDEPYCPHEIGYKFLEHYPNCVIAGGYVDNLISPKWENENREASLMSVAFCGPNVHVASVVLHEEIDTAEEVEKVIKKLKDCNLPEEKSFAFMFACIGRGHAHFGGIRNVESSVFKKYFPKTPLFGFFGNGEIGFNRIYKYGECSQTNSSTTSKPPPKLYNAYTTIICLLSIT